MTEFSSPSLRRGLALGVMLFCLAVRPFAADEVGKQGASGPPQLKVAVWSVLIEEPMARTLQSRGVALTGKTEKYQGYAIGAKELLAVLKTGQAACQVHFVPSTMSWFEDCDQTIGEKTLFPNTFGGRIEIKKDLHCEGNLIIPAFYRLTSKGGAIHLKWHGNGVARLDEHERMDLPHALHAQVQGSLDYEGDLKAGEALCYLAPLDKARVGSPAWQLIAVQAVAVGVADAPYLTSFADLERWLADGPEGALEAIHEAQTAQASAATAASQTKRRSHPSQPVPPAGMLRLRAIGQPARWPFQWWDGDGNPIAGAPAWQRLAAGNTLAVYLETQGIEGMMDIALKARGAAGTAEDVPGGISPTNEGASPGSMLIRLFVQPERLNDREKVARLLDDRTPLELVVTCGTGEWSKIADIQEGKEVAAGGGRFLLKSVRAERAKTSNWPGLTGFDLDYDFDPAFDVMLVGVDRQGNRGKSSAAVGGGNFTHRAGRLLFSSIEMEKDAIEHFELLKRPVQTYTFTGIASFPEGKAGGGGQPAAAQGDGENHENKNTASEKTAVSGNPWRKNLPNGAEVEMVYIGVRGDQPFPWWRPDGTVIPRPMWAEGDFEMLNRRRLLAGPIPLDPVQREVVFKLSSAVKLTEDDLLAGHYTIQPPPGNSHRIFGPQTDGSLLVAGFFASLPSTLTLRLGVAAGPWTVVNTYKPGANPTTKDEAGWTSIFHRPDTSKFGGEGTHIAVAYDPPTGDRAALNYRLVARRKDCTLDARPSYSVSPSVRAAGVGEQIDATFKLALDEVTEFQLQASEYQWAEFTVPAAAASKPGRRGE